MNNLLLTSQTELKLEKFSVNKSFFGFLSSEILPISITLYKTDFILLLNDSSIIVYDTKNNQKKYEINECSSYSPSQIEILFYNNNKVKKDYLLILCESKIVVLNSFKYTIEYEYELNEKSNFMKIHSVDDLYLIVVIHKEKISFHNIVKSTKYNCGFSFYLYYELYTEKRSYIFSRDILLFDNLVALETENNFEFSTYNTKSSNQNKTLIFNKKLSFSNDFLTNSELSILSQNLNSLKSLKNRELNYYKISQISYSSLSNLFFFCFINKLLVIKSFYDPKIQKFTSIENKLTIIERMIKPNVILFSKVVEPYFFLICETRLYIYLVLDINRCIDACEIDMSYNFIFSKPTSLLKNLNLLNFEYDLIQYNDVFLINEMKKNPNSSPLTSSRPMIFIYNNNEHTIKWIYLCDINKQLKQLKIINSIFASKYLATFSFKQNLSILENSDLYNNSNLIKANEKFVLFKCLEIFYTEISKNKFDNAINIVEENRLGYIFIFILFGNIIKSKVLKILIEYYLKYFLSKYIEMFLENEVDFGELKEKNIDEIDKEFKKHNSIILSLIKNVQIKSIQDLPFYIKKFLNKFIEKRNTLKLKIPKVDRRKISFETISKIVSEVKNEKDECLSYIENFEQFSDLNENFTKEKFTEEIIDFCLCENIIFLLNYYAYKISKQEQFSKNLTQMIKGSYNILDNEIVIILNEMKLEEEILLYYYCKENYDKCITSIIEIYNEIDDKKEIDTQENYEGGKENLTSNISLSSDGSDDGNKSDSSNNDNINNRNLFTKKIESTKEKWLDTYITLICKISKKLSQFEFDSYLKWALEKNSLKTIDFLFINKKISNTKIDENFIKILKAYGVDPVIYYLEKFSNLEGNESESNEMINLYVIKIKLLSEQNQDEDFKNNILKTRNELASFLIKNQNYNISHAYDKIIQIPFCQREIGIVLIKQSNYEEGIPKIFIDDEGSDTKSFENSMKIILLLVENIPEFDLIFILIKKLKNFPFINKEKVLEDLIIQILEKIQNRSNLIIKLLATDIFDDLDSFRLTEYFVILMNYIQGTKEKYKIEGSLMENKILSELSKLYDLQSNYYEINEKTICSQCKEKIVKNPPIMYKKKERKDNNVNRGVIGNDCKVYHEECYDYMMNNGM